MTKFKNKTIIISFFAIFVVIVSVWLSSIAAIAFAAQPTSDGTYSVSVSNDMPMGGSNVSSEGILEREGGVCYLSITFNEAKLANPVLEIDGKRVGAFIRDTEGDWVTYTYTFSEDNVSKSLPFTAYVVPMQKEREFHVTADVSEAVRMDSEIADFGERPAEFVPVLTTQAGGEYMLETGSVFTLPNATASLGEYECEITIAAYYVRDSKPEAAILEGRRLRLKNSGEYRVIYRASSPLYKTSAGNDTYSQYEVSIFSKVGAVGAVEYEDINGVLPAEVSLQSSRITSGTVYDMAVSAMREISDRFQILDIGLFDTQGEAVVLTDVVQFTVHIDEEFVNKEIEVYLLRADGKLGKLNCIVANDTVMFDSNVTGTFIVCIPGVAFVMPMWGYAIIVCVGGAIIIAAAITIPIVVVKKRKKKKLQEAKE